MLTKLLEARVKPTNWGGQGFRTCEFKYDGYRIGITKDAFGNIRCIGRKKYNDFTDHLIGKLPLYDLPNNSIIDGEVYVPDGESCNVMTALNVGEGWEFTAFDLIQLDGKKPTSFEERDRWLQEVGIDPPTTVGVKWDRNWIPIKEDLESLAKSMNLEGFVVKAGLRHGWWKIKPVNTLDAIITKMIEGEGRLQGTLGAFEVSLYNVAGELVPICTVGSGLTDAQRHLYWPQDLTGSVVEVAYDKVQKSRLRFPRFLRIREDKPSEECNEAQLSGL